MKKNYFIYLTVLPLLFSLISATEPLAFLHLPADADAMGLAEIGTIHRQSTASILANPAGISALDHTVLSISHSELFQGINKAYMSFIFPVERAAVGISLNMLYTENNQEIFSDNALNDFRNLQFSLAGAVDLIKNRGFNLSAGASAFYLSEELLESDTPSVAFSAGLQAAFKTKIMKMKMNPAYNLVLGLAVRNFGKSFTLGSRTYSPPLSAAAGISYTPVSAFKLCAEGRYFKNKEPELSLALEGFPNSVVRPRIGTILGKDSPVLLTAGLDTGFNLKSFLLSLNYAADFLTEAEIRHYFTLTLGYRRLKNNTPEEENLPLGPLGVKQKLKDKLTQRIAEERERQDPDDKQIYVAILPFLNISRSKAYKHLDQTLSDNLKYEFKQHSRAKILDIYYIKAALSSLGLENATLNNRQEIIELAKIIKADLVIYGTYEKIEGELYCNYNILDTETDAILKRKHTSAKIVKNFFKILDKISKQIFVDIKGFLDHN